MNFRQFDNEHVAQTWERMKSMIEVDCHLKSYGLENNMNLDQRVFDAQEKQKNFSKRFQYMKILLKS